MAILRQRFSINIGVLLFSFSLQLCSIAYAADILPGKPYVPVKPPLLQFDLTSKDINTFYLLGFLGGSPRHIRGNSTVNFFYRNEKVAAKIFEDQFLNFLKVRHIDEPAGLAVSDEGHFIFNNQAAADILDSFYSWKANDRGWITESKLLNSTKEEKLAFLLGEYLRNGGNLQFSVIDGREANLLSRILKAVGSSQIIVNRDPICPDCEPQDWYVSFSLTDDLEALIRSANTLKKNTSHRLDGMPGWGKP